MEIDYLVEKFGGDMLLIDFMEEEEKFDREIICEKKCRLRYVERWSNHKIDDNSS